MSPRELPRQPLPARALYRRCEPGRLPFETSDELEPLPDGLGQDRALEALHFGVGIQQRGYNIFALGPSGVGKRDSVCALLEERASAEPVPPDWCYVNNFDEEHRPRALRLPPGKGVELRDDMQRFIERLGALLPAAFESGAYKAQLRLLEGERDQRRERSLHVIEKRAEQRGLTLVRTPLGMAIAPTREGQIVMPDSFNDLAEGEQERLRSDIQELTEDLQHVVEELPVIEREHHEKVQELNRTVARATAAQLVAELRRKYCELPEITGHLAKVQDSVVENVHEFLDGEGAHDGRASEVLRALFSQTPAFQQYSVNVIVDHAHSSGAPVVVEDRPSHQHLLGRVEHRAYLGALITDFTLIKSGALHRANGGYLVLDARKLLLQPFAWEELKRALRAGQIRIEPLDEMLGMARTVTLEPEAIPLDVKVTLLGERVLYYLLADLDPDFLELFKVAADFEDDVARSDESELLYARSLATIVKREQLRSFHRSAIARVIEFASRLAGDAEKLSAERRTLRDLMREADYWAGVEGSEVVRGADVQRAIDAQVRRADRLRARIQEDIQRGTRLIDTEGARAGQVNGLSVVGLGGFSFGHPVRITARVRIGKGEIVDIEREAALSGPIHQKGVLILAGFLGQRYAPDIPLSLSASLVFEQSYGGVEGDSASAAELFAILSALADAPVRQSIAVTGSVNQHGRIQPVGGINEKIEGFFDACRARRLSGEQGVIVPAANVKHLMLRKDVVSAVQEGRFAIWPIESVDEGLSLLTGLEAGERDAGGRFPEGSLNARVEVKLREFAETTSRFLQRSGGVGSERRE